MVVLRCFVFTLVIYMNKINGVDSNCILSLKKDFGNPSPVFIKNGDFLAPNTRNGDISLRRSEAVLVACTGDKRHLVLGNDTTDIDAVEAQCVSNTTFRIGRWMGHFKDIRCNSQPWFTAEPQEACYGGNILYRVGYRIGKKIHTLYEACFDKNLLSTLYVQHELTPASKYLQSGARPQFIEGSLFGKTRMSELYKTSNQKNRLSAVLGEGMDEKYLSKNQFLTRGHLAPRADFPLRATQRATFHYVNTAPQWMRGNAGDWAALEDALRRRVNSHNISLTVYTGAHGVVTLRSASGKLEELYLDADANNNFVVPVPLYFYKVVYDPKRKTAAAFVSINSSFYNNTMIKDLTFCSDICEDDSNYSWLRWRSNDGTHSFCCDYDDFVEKINCLPKLDVRGMFY